MKKVIIYGAGSLAREIFEYATGDKNFDTQIIGYTTDFGVNEEFQNFTKLKFFNFNEVLSTVMFLVCISEPTARKKIFDKIESKGFKAYTYIHPTALISKSSKISEGCIIYPYSVVSTNTFLGVGVVINSYSGIGHDVKVGNFTTISAQIDLAGFVTIGNQCFLGSGSRVLPNKKIGDNCKIGAGVTVIRSMASGTTALPVANNFIKL